MSDSALSARRRLLLMEVAAGRVHARAEEGRTVIRGEAVHASTKEFQRLERLGLIRAVGQGYEVTPAGQAELQTGRS